MGAQPGSDLPSASASAFMVDAVPMVLQWPIEGAVAAAISMNSSAVARPAAISWRACQIAVPEPARSPFHQPLSIGPPDSTSAEVFTVAAAMMQQGTGVLHPGGGATPDHGEAERACNQRRHRK